MLFSKPSRSHPRNVFSSSSPPLRHASFPPSSLVVSDISLTSRDGLEVRLAMRTQGLERCLAQAAKNGPSIWAALALKAAFEETLVAWKSEREAVYAAELKEDNAQYKQASDGRWLADREEAMKAELAGELLEARVALVQWLSAWMGDVIRAKMGGLHRDLLKQTSHTAAFGEKLSLQDLLKRTDSLKELSNLLETNAHEGLVLETSLIGAFG